MKIITVNVNGIRAAEKKGFFEWLKKENADVVCLQEIKAQEDQLDERFYPKEYHCYYHPAEKKGYSGTAIFSKKKPNKIIKKTNWETIDFEGRLIQADFDDLSVVSIYVHSGSAKQERQDIKMAFLTQRFMPYLKQLKADGKKVILCGDVNIVHQKRDIKNFTGNKNRSGCLPEERAYLDELFNQIGFIDAFRAVNQEDHQYTWWSNRGQAWANNTGWRIDYQILTPNLQGTVKNTRIYKEERFSDHAPLIMEYQFSTSVSGYINQIAEQSSKSKRYIYRGQPKIYSDGITSTAKRRFKHSGRTPNEDEYFEYHTNLIRDARSYRYGQKLELNDTELLIDLQHYGAATGLIDFSEDLLIALWFACDKPDENGKVFFLDVWTDQFEHLVSGGDLFKEKDKTKPPHYYLHTNFKSNARISAQKGVFIFGYQDIDIDNVASITIKKEDKVFIRQELKQYFNIEEKTLFQDIYGFAQVNNTKHKLSIKTESDYFQEAYEEDNAEQAIVLYQKAIGIKPDDAAYYNMGNAYGELGEYQKAINAYQKAIEIKLDMHEAYNNMGNAYNELKKYQKAINACQKAIEIKPDNHEAYNNMGNAYNGLKEYQKAINIYQKAIEIKPNDMAYYNMGVVYKELKEYQKAINAYQKAIEIKPNDVAYNNMGDAYDELKEYQKAINAYQKGIEIKPNDVAYNNMGNAYGELKEYQKAINAYQKAIEIKPDKHEAYYNMGNAYGKLGEYQKAINAYKKAIEIKPDMHEAYYNMGNVYGKLGEYQKEINAYQKAIEIKPDDNEAYNNMGVAYNKLKEYQKAINAYQKAIEIKPDNHGAYYNMGNAYGELKEYQKAINAYQKASAIFPSLIDYAKKQNFDLLESYINNLDDSPVKQQNLFILNQLQGHD